MQKNIKENFHDEFFPFREPKRSVAREHIKCEQNVDRQKGEKRII